MKNSNFTHRLTQVFCGVVASVLLGGFTSCSDSLLTGTPEWLGSSIYEELQQRGDFNTTVQLYNMTGEDLVNTLKRTGSRTVFVANDDAWQRFFLKNSQLPVNDPWHTATSLENLTAAQRNLLVNSSIISSAYLIELMGNIPAATDNGEITEGTCMRRMTSQTAYDSIPRVTKADYPEVNPHRLNGSEQIDYWAHVREKDTIMLFQDNTAPTMTHFTPAFMQTAQFQDIDIKILSGDPDLDKNSTVINGLKLTQADNTCQNGYIQVLQNVPLSLPNMAQIINDTKNEAGEKEFKIFSSLLERFSYPMYDRNLSNDYGNGDSVFVKRYFNNYGANGLTKDYDGKPASNVLPFDPGWNGFYLYTAANKYTYQYNGGLIMVPSDEAMEEYLKTSGKDLVDKYGPTWDCMPDEIVLPFLQNCMQTSLLAALPTKLKNVNNSAGQSMDLSEASIAKAYLASNGAVYKMKHMIVAPEFNSVYAPLLIRSTDDLQVSYRFIEEDAGITGAEGYKSYLNNMPTGKNGEESSATRYSFIIPTDEALQSFIDVATIKRPAVEGQTGPLLYSFYYDKVNQCVRAYPYNYTMVDGKPVKGDLVSWNGGTLTETQFAPILSESSGNWLSSDMFNHFKDLLDNVMVTKMFEYPQTIYKTKGGGPLMVKWEGGKVVGVAGSRQFENGQWIPVDQENIYEKIENNGNGISYVVNEVPQCTVTSPYAVITDEENADFAPFASLLEGTRYIRQDDGNKHVTLDNAIDRLNNFNYTIYVPQAEAVNALIAEHKLPTWEDIDSLKSCIRLHGDLMQRDTIFNEVGKRVSVLDSVYNCVAEMTAVVDSFVCYHIQDNALYLGGDNVPGNMYETALLDPKLNKFKSLIVNYDLGTNRLTVQDQSGKTYTVINEKSNKITRQYFFNSEDLDKARKIYSSSYAVIHYIDGALVPGDSYLYSPDKYRKIMDLVDTYYNSEL